MINSVEADIDCEACFTSQSPQTSDLPAQACYVSAVSQMELVLLQQDLLSQIWLQMRITLGSEAARLCVIVGSEVFSPAKVYWENAVQCLLHLHPQSYNITGP